MLFEIKNGELDNELFCIEVYLKSYKTTNGNELWCSKVLVKANSVGIGRYTYDHVHNDEELGRFLTDCNKVEKLKWLAYGEAVNGLLPFEEANERHASVFIPKIKAAIEDFCNKHKDAWMNED